MTLRTRTVAATLAAAVIAIALIVTVAYLPDNGQLRRFEVISAIRQDSALANASDATSNCLADWYLDNDQKDQLESLMTDSSSATKLISGKSEESLLHCLALSA